METGVQYGCTLRNHLQTEITRDVVIKGTNQGIEHSYTLFVTFEWPQIRGLSFRRSCYVSIVLIHVCSI